ncbi:hypothetical protein B0A52_04654 [Exophiala mesophila]|uniref:Uncharacterized protein n=1 Tax=Exophiala mesophila TaxID=212818 RepID=A0A438N8F6_EXOME|nr:hypothetical protein B0A52_04654 [Exophiala mesophila]
MEQELTTLKATLADAFNQFAGPLKSELSHSLHTYEKDHLPHKQLSELAAEAVDLLHSIEQLLTPPPLIVADHFLGYVDTKCLCAVVQLGIPDELQKGGKTICELSRSCNAHEHRLKQVMRVLSNKGIFSWDATTQVYRNNATSELLTRDHWTQWRNWVDLYGTEFYDIARGIPASLCLTPGHKTRTAAQINFNTDENMFTYFTAQGWLPRLHKTLGGGATAQSPGIEHDYPWHEFGDGPFLDVGGGEGALVALLLRRLRCLRGALFDSTSVIQHARTLFYEKDGKFADVVDQIAPNGLISGDFFDQLPSFEFYTMKWCLHDWKDDDASRILSNIRRAIKVTQRSRLVVLESILTDGRSGRLSRYADINMMMTADGQERTEEEWRSLAKENGWEVARICHLRGAWPSAIELRPIA